MPSAAAGKSKRARLGPPPRLLVVLLVLLLLRVVAIVFSLSIVIVSARGDYAVTGTGRAMPARA